MPVLWPVYYRNFEGETPLCDSSMDGASCSSTQLQGETILAAAEQAVSSETTSSKAASEAVPDFSHSALEAPVTSQSRRRRRSRRAPATATTSEDALTFSEIGALCDAVQETERQLLTNTHTEVAPERSLKAPELKRAASSSSSTSVSQHSSPQSSRIGSWADAVDSESEVEVPAPVEEVEPQPNVDPLLLQLDDPDKVKQQEAIQEVISSVWALAVTRHGCRIVQRALEVATAGDQQLIAETLQGHVLEALKSPNANHVLQKCIEIMPPEKIHFVLQELRGHGAFVARHRFGCRILQRLIEHCPPVQTADLIAEVLVDASKLLRHQYGNFVIQHVLQHGSPDQVHQIAEVIGADVIRLAKHRIASHVVSCAMVHCSPEDVQRLTQVVLGEAGQLADLTRRQYGSFVVREVHRAVRLQGQSQ
jgi:hypothetical protein